MSSLKDTGTEQQDSLVDNIKSEKSILIEEVEEEQI
jgi:hypothetical protein